MNADQITAQLRKLDVPPHKLDVTKSGTVQWLLDNLRQRNDMRGELYCSCMEHLMELAKANNWVKKTKLQELAAHIGFVRGNMSQILEQRGNVEAPKTGLERLKADIAAGGFKVGQIAVMAGTSSRFSGAQSQRSNVPQANRPIINVKRRP